MKVEVEVVVAPPTKIDPAEARVVPKIEVGVVVPYSDNTPTVQDGESTKAGCGSKGSC